MAGLTKPNRDRSSVKNSTEDWQWEPHAGTPSSSAISRRWVLAAEGLDAFRILGKVNEWHHSRWNSRREHSRAAAVFDEL